MFDISMSAIITGIAAISMICLIGCYIPQMLLLLKNKSAKDVSFYMYAVRFIGVATQLWVMYLTDTHYVLKIQAILGLIVNMTIMLLIVRYRHANKKIGVKYEA